MAFPFENTFRQIQDRNKNKNKKTKTKIMVVNNASASALAFYALFFVLSSRNKWRVYFNR